MEERKRKREEAKAKAEGIVQATTFRPSDEKEKEARTFNERVSKQLTTMKIVFAQPAQKKITPMKEGESYRQFVNRLRRETRYLLFKECLFANKDRQRSYFGGTNGE